VLRKLLLLLQVNQTSENIVGVSLADWYPDQCCHRHRHLNL